MVGRPRQFDEAEVLDAAIQAFWAKGYEATSMADLLEVTGLHKGSLYQAFGDKHTLFVAALRRYLEGMRSRKNVLLRETESPLEGIRIPRSGR
jgi:TetR/AcrR family transcriptional repressor of nem operon